MSDEVEIAPEASGSPVVEKSQIAKEFEALAAQEPAVPALDEINESLTSESEVDVPISDFWDNKTEAVEEAVETPAGAEVGEEASDVSPGETIKFKANGKEVELTFDEARKRLALAEGGAQAFTKLAVANQKVKELESKLPDLEKYKGLFDKLESVKHNEDELIKIISGKDPETWKADFLRKQRIQTTGSDAEKAQLIKEERLSQLERQLEAQRSRQEELEKNESDRLYKSEKDSLKTMLESEFTKHRFSMGNDVDSNDVNEMLWQQGRLRMTEYVKKYQQHPKFQELLPKMAQKSFEDVAGKLNRLTTGSVQAKVDEAIKAKKVNAAEKAATASTRRMADVNPDDFKGLSVREIADKMLGKKKFTF